MPNNKQYLIQVAPNTAAYTTGTFDLVPATTE